MGLASEFLASKPPEDYSHEEEVVNHLAEGENCVGSIEEWTLQQTRVSSQGREVINVGIGEERPDVGRDERRCLKPGGIGRDKGEERGA